MNDDKDTPGSGSRWEPAAVPDAATPAAGPPAPPEAPTAEVPYEVPASEPPAAVPAPRRALRGRVALAGVGAALAVAGGVGGFALGHAAAGDDVDESSVVHGTDPGGDGGNGFPGRPGFGDRGNRPDVDGALPGDPDGDDSGTGDSGTGDSGTDDSAGDGTT